MAGEDSLLHNLVGVFLARYHALMKNIDIFSTYKVQTSDSIDRQILNLKKAESYKITHGIVAATDRQLIERVNVKSQTYLLIKDDNKLLEYIEGHKMHESLRYVNDSNRHKDRKYLT